MKIPDENIFWPSKSDHMVCKGQILLLDISSIVSKFAIEAYTKDGKIFLLVNYSMLELSNIVIIFMILVSSYLSRFYVS